jgi:hypothetical protein
MVFYRGIYYVYIVYEIIMTGKAKKMLLEIPDLLLICLYVYTAFIKIKDITLFKIKLYKSPLINPNYVDYIAYSIPIVELGIVFLLFTKFKTTAHYISILLLTFFIGYIFLLNNYSIYNGCGCGGIFEKLSLGEHIMINFLFIMISIGKLLFIKMEKTESNLIKIT